MTERFGTASFPGAPLPSDVGGGGGGGVFDIFSENYPRPPHRGSAYERARELDAL